MKYMIIDSPIQKLSDNIWIKREDLIPFSFGGNKARKAEMFFKDFDEESVELIDVSQ